MRGGAFLKLVLPVVDASSVPFIYRFIAPVDCFHEAATCTQLPVFTLETDIIVISVLPVPNASLLLTRDVPQSLVTPPTSASTIPFPLYHCVPPGPVEVVFIQNSTVKSLLTT